MYRSVLSSILLCGCAAGISTPNEPTPVEKLADSPVERSAPYETEGKAIFIYYHSYGGWQYFVLSHDSAPHRLSIWWGDQLRWATRSKFPSTKLSKPEVEELLSALATMKREARNAATCKNAGLHRSHMLPGYVQYNPDTDDPTCRTIQDAALTVMRIAGVSCGTRGCTPGSP
jgi:hypothetical protein